SSTWGVRGGRGAPISWVPGSRPKPADRPRPNAARSGPGDGTELVDHHQIWAAHAGVGRRRLADPARSPPRLTVARDQYQIGAARLGVAIGQLSELGAASVDAGRGGAAC